MCMCKQKTYFSITRMQRKQPRLWSEITTIETNSVDTKSMLMALTGLVCAGYAGFGKCARISLDGEKEGKFTALLGQRSWGGRGLNFRTMTFTHRLHADV